MRCLLFLPRGGSPGVKGFLSAAPGCSLYQLSFFPMHTLARGEVWFHLDWEDAELTSCHTTMGPVSSHSSVPTRMFPTELDSCPSGLIKQQPMFHRWLCGAGTDHRFIPLQYLIPEFLLEILRHSFFHSPLSDILISPWRTSLYLSLPFNCSA